jgi:hypothetical protein
MAGMLERKTRGTLWKRCIAGKKISDIGPEMLSPPQVECPGIHMKKSGEPIVKARFIPDSHFSSAIDYYCYF